MTNHKDFLTKLHQNLNILREKEAKYGGNAPLDLLNQINDHQAAIELTQQVLVEEISETEWQEALKPLLLSIKADIDEVTGGVTIGDIQGGIHEALIAGRDMFIIHIHNLPEVTAPPPVVEDTQIPECPYRGLFTFRPEHAHFFFGRETFTQQLVEAVENRPFVAVLGASGSGKSSVVFAGLVPTLLSQTGESWLFTTFRPGDNPFLGLANALVPLLAPELSKIKQIGEARDLATRLRKGSSPLSDYINSIHQTHPDKRLLIIVDQFEELYTLGDDPAGRQQFLDMLLDLIKAVQGASPRIVLTLRADFLSQASLYRPFADILQGTTEILGPMTRAEMADAIAKPAALQAVNFEPKLIDTILDDVGEEGNLPLLEFALTELWQYQRQRTLTHVAYVEIGEIKGALSRHADKAYQRLTPTEQEQARQVFVQLVNPGKGTGDTRRLATRSELENNWLLVTKLANERLVMTNQVKGKQDTVEVVHEALIRHWGLLRSWMAEARTFRSWQERLRFSMEEWQTNKDSTTLLRGAPLAEAESWLIKRPGDLSAAEKSYINASLDQRHQREKRRKLIFVSTVIVAILMAGLAILSFTQFQAATTERNKAAISEAIAVHQKATAEAAGTVIAHQKDAIKAELEFYQTADLQTQVNYLVTLLDRPGYESQAAKLFWGLPTQKSRRDLFRVKDDRVVKVIKELYVTLADVNQAGYADPILSGMIEALVTSGQAPELKTELEAWLQARRKARDKPDQEVLAAYDKLISQNNRNLAYLYERAAIQIELVNYQAALADLEEVMTLVDNPVFGTSGMVDSEADFATVEQITLAVRRLIEMTPDLGRLLNNSASGFPHLQQFGLVFAPTPTPITNSIDGARMVLVPAGPFKMGSNYGESNEQPVHEVALGTFYIDQYEITNALYRECVKAGVCEKPECIEGTEQTYDDKSKQNHPVACVSWPQAKIYCEWRGGRLPTEAEWEKSARGIDGRTYPWGEHLAPHLARYNSQEGTAPVGSYPTGISPYGAYDMMGNVWEWAGDWFDTNYYSYSPIDNPTGPQNGEYKVIRGGSWYFNDVGARTTFRNQYRSPQNKSPYVGFRCVADVP